MSTNSNTEMMIIELCNQQDSGFIQKGTEGKPWENQIRCADRFRVPSEGWRRKYKVDESGKFILDKDDNKIPDGIEEIQYIEGQDEIRVAEQKKLGLLNDKGLPLHGKSQFIITKGYRTIFKEDDRALFEYAMTVFWSEDAPDRPEKADKMFRISRPDLATEKLNEDDFVRAEAVLVCKSLVEKVGSKQIYKEDKMNSLMNLFGVTSDTFTNENKLARITDFAKKQPQTFLEIYNKMEQITLTEIDHAIELRVIRFEKQAWSYVAKDKIIFTLPEGNYKQQQRITMLADYLRTNDGFEAFNELKIEVAQAKEKLTK